jgi:hypothetical protein
VLATSILIDGHICERYVTCGPICDLYVPILIGWAEAPITINSTFANMRYGKAKKN